MPLAALICSKAVSDEIKPGDHGSTFGGNPVALSAALKVIEQLDEKSLNENSGKGNELKKAIENLASDKIKEVRGKGLMIGIEFKEGISAKNIAKILLSKKIVVGTSGDSVLRLLPPFIINTEVINKFIKVFDDVLNEV